MKKSLLLHFIDKYYLKGTTESALWIAENNVLKASFITPDKHLVGIVTANIPLWEPTFEYGLFQTSVLLDLLSVVGDDVTVRPQIVNTKPVALEISDPTGTSVTFVLANKATIDVPPKLKEPAFDITLQWTSAVTEKILKSKAALSDESTISISTSALRIGHKKVNSNRITVPITTTDISGKSPTELHFNLPYLRNVLTVCKQMELHVSLCYAGLLRIIAKEGDITATYYLAATTITD